jgi:ubiquinone/menaquinone biosynthesis C-methylase UbiE
MITGGDFLVKFHARQYILPLIRQMKAQPKNGSAFLDLGCGYGYLAEKISQMGFFVVGVDILPERVFAARKMRPAVNFVIADAIHLPFRSESFEGIISHSVLTYTRIELSVNEAHRVLKHVSGAFFIACEFNAMNPWVRLKSGFNSREILAPQDYRNLFVRAGFMEVVVRAVDFLPTRVRRIMPEARMYHDITTSIEMVFSRFALSKAVGGFVLIIASPSKFD